MDLRGKNPGKPGRGWQWPYVITSGIFKIDTARWQSMIAPKVIGYSPIYDDDLWQSMVARMDSEVCGMGAAEAMAVAGRIVEERMSAIKRYPLLLRFIQWPFDNVHIKSIYRLERRGQGKEARYYISGETLDLPEEMVMEIAEELTQILTAYFQHGHSNDGVVKGQSIVDAALPDVLENIKKEQVELLCHWGIHEDKAIKVSKLVVDKVTEDVGLHLKKNPFFKETKKERETIELFGSVVSFFKKKLGDLKIPTKKGFENISTEYATWLAAHFLIGAGILLEKDGAPPSAKKIRQRIWQRFNRAKENQDRLTKDARKRDRVKHICPECGKSIVGRLDLFFICSGCDMPMEIAEGEEPSWQMFDHPRRERYYCLQCEQIAHGRPDLAIMCGKCQEPMAPNRVEYTCGGCEKNAVLGRPDLMVHCGDCGHEYPMKTVDQKRQ